MRNKMDLSIGVSLGSSMQISMFVTPLLVLVGWVLNQPLTMCFPIIDVAIMFITVLVVNHTIQDGESNCIIDGLLIILGLEGFMLIIGYIIIAFTYYYVPSEPDSIK